MKINQSYCNKFNLEGLNKIIKIKHSIKVRIKILKN